ncbi:PAS domain-containing protein [Hymenobacter sp. BRD67]|uniref:PAS domain-containing protein n=1 Tax=Hymenobacter sp. BRD67 TaxID=2675877 RepID=UPI001563235B|nr:PAS domain-containing protein [Hymenobacter sp. BRD67]QKG52382.1 PAS domain-containing protein [Hymenobacter sp. BRD67]
MPGSPDLLAVFDALPGAYLLLSPALRIEAVSDAYLAATLTTRSQLIGQYMFEAFPDNPATPEARSVANLSASLQQVLKSGQPHQMALQHYDVPDPTTPGAFVARYWEPLNSPVLDAQGMVSGIIHHVVNVTDRLSTEAQLRESQAREQQAWAEVDAQRRHLQQILRHLPAQVATYQGPDYVYDFVNTRYTQPFPTRRYLGRPFREVLPEVAEQGLEAAFDHVYRTGEPYHIPEQELWLDLAGTGQPEQLYLNFFLHPLRDAEGHIYGLLDFSYDITAQVLARRQVQQLNQELETRVQQRTREAETARAEAEEQRNRLLRLFGQAPAQINLFQGPNHIWTLVHPRTQEMLPNRKLLGLPRRQALPELPEEQQEPFDRVYRTGHPVHVFETVRRLDRFEDGELHDEYFDVTFQPKFDAAGQIEGVMSFAVNVTERVRARKQAEALQAEMLAAAQRQAQEREALFHILADTPAAVALLRGPQHQFEYVNTAYQQLFPERQLTGRSVAEALPETRAAGFLTQLDRVYRTGETFFGQELPMRLEPADGRPAQQVYYTFTYQAYRENDQVAGISIFAFDVTEQVQAREQREAERQQLYHLFMEAPAPIVILDGPDLVYQLVNPAYQRVFPGRTLLGKPVLEALPELLGTPILDQLRGVYTTGTTLVAQEMPLLLARHDNGPLEELFFTFTYQARRNTQGHWTGCWSLPTKSPTRCRPGAWWRRAASRRWRWPRSLAW